MEGGVHYFNTNVKLFFPFVFTVQYKQNPEMFKQTARLWSHVYAGAPVSSPEYTRKIDKLCAMGFEKVSVSKSSLSPALNRDVKLSQNKSACVTGFVFLCRMQ